MTKVPSFDPAHPDLQIDLTPIIPAGEIPNRFINRYRAVEKVRCAFCPKHTEHNNGVTAEMKDGRTALCGIDCAVKHFGRDVVRGLEAELARQEALIAKRRQLEPAIAGADHVAERLLRWLPVEGLIDQLVWDLQEALSETEYHRRMTEGGTLQRASIQVEWIEHQRADGGELRRAHENATILGTVHGARLLMLDSAPLRAAYEDLAKIVRLSRRDLLAMNDAQIAQALPWKVNALRLLASGIERFDLAQRFLVEDNIRELHKWARTAWDRSPKIQWVKRGSGAAILAKPPGEDTMWEMIVPDLSEIPTHDDLIQPLRSRVFDVAA